VGALKPNFRHENFKGRLVNRENHPKTGKIPNLPTKRALEEDQKEGRKEG